MASSTQQRTHEELAVIKKLFNKVCQSYVQEEKFKGLNPKKQKAVKQQLNHLSASVMDAAKQVVSIPPPVPVDPSVEPLDTRLIAELQELERTAGDLMDELMRVKQQAPEAVHQEIARVNQECLANATEAARRAAASDAEAAALAMQQQHLPDVHQIGRLVNMGAEVSHSLEDITSMITKETETTHNLRVYLEQQAVNAGRQ